MLNVYKLLLELFSFSFFFFISVYDTVFYFIFFIYPMLSVVLDFENRFLHQFMQGKFLLIIVT